MFHENTRLNKNYQENVFRKKDTLIKKQGAVEQSSQSLFDITVGKCGKSGLFGRSSGCVELKSKTHDDISIQKKKVLTVE